MDLKDFVSQALCDIIGGIEKAQKQTAAGIICPHGLEDDNALKYGISTIMSTISNLDGVICRIGQIA